MGEPDQAAAGDRLEGYDEADRQRIMNIASSLVEAQIALGQIPATEDAIQAAIPKAVQDAKATVNAMWEYLSG